MERTYINEVQKEIGSTVKVQGFIENLRNSKAIGGNLQAEVTLYGDEALQQSLAKLDDELRFAMITSAATVAPLTDAPLSLTISRILRRL